MRVLLLAAITIDGKIARGPREAVDWSSREDKRLFMRVSQESGVLIMGRGTYETLEAPLPKRLHVVMTHHPEHLAANHPEQVEFTADAPAEIVSKLAARGYETAVLAGGAETYHAFIEAGMVDELWLTLEPLAFGGGISLLGDGPLNLRLRLLHHELLNESSLHLRYGVEPHPLPPLP